MYGYIYPFVSPIETFNDSNTSEYDDTWCDSRQEDSTTFDVNNQEAEFGNLDNNEFVLDADVRKLNRTNVEMIMLMNQRKTQALESGLAALNQMDKNNRIGRSKGSLQSTYSQTGVLPVASLVEATEKQQTIMRQQQQQQQQHDLDLSQNNNNRTLLNRASVSSDQESNDSMSVDSYSSSGIKFPLAINDFDMATIRVSVRRLSTEELNELTANNNEQQANKQLVEITNKTKMSSISTIAEKLSIGKFPRQSSQTQTSSNYCYEVELIEARNIAHSQHQSQQQTKSHHSSTTNSQESTPRTTSRRASIMNALMPSGSIRRSSLDGVFVRVFKSQQSLLTQHQQSNTIDVSAKQVPPKLVRSANSQSVDSDTYSVSSSSILDLGYSSEYIQSPMSRQQNGTVVFEPNSMKIICHEHEFPLRVSLYQLDKKGARYTVGHCFVSLEDWLSDSDHNTLDSGTSEITDPQSMDRGRKDSQSDEQMSSSRSSTISEGIAQGRSSLCLTGLPAVLEQQKIRFTIIERPSTHRRIIDFKLYQTIFDAIK